MVITGNIAYGKNASSQTVYQDYIPRLAVDGNTDPDAYNKHCFHSGHTTDTAWWMVDLGEPYIIYNVTIYNRQRGIVKLPLL